MHKPLSKSEILLIREKEAARLLQISNRAMWALGASGAIPFIKKAEGGSIVLISSSAAWFGYPYRSPYSASKWAVLGLMKTLAMELGPSGIRVNALCPGSVKGPRIDAVVKNEAKLREVLEEEVREGYERQVSMRSFVETNDIAEMILFLASKHGKMISGQAIGIDGHTETLTNF